MLFWTDKSMHSLFKSGRRTIVHRKSNGELAAGDSVFISETMSLEILLRTFCRSIYLYLLIA